MSNPPPRQRLPRVTPSYSDGDITMTGIHPVAGRGGQNLWRAADASIRARVLVPTAGLFTVAVIGMAAISMRLHSGDMKHEQEDRSRVVARMIASELATAMLNSGADHVPELFAGLVAYRPDIHSISLVRPGGEISVSSEPALIGTRPWTDMTRYQHTTLVREKSRSGSFAVVEPIRNQQACARCHEDRIVGDVYGWLDVRVAGDSAIDWNLARVLALTAIPMLLLLIGILWWLLGLQVVKPLRRLMDTMRAARRGDTTATADEGRTDELGEVARSFDATFGKLRRAQREIEHFYRERSLQVDRFAAVGELATGLAHEIKNPLAGLSGALELLGEDLQEPMQVELVTEMRAQLQRLTATMNGMLNFARPPKVLLRPTDVRDCVSNVAFLVRQHARKQPGQVDIVLDLDPSVALAHADPTQLEQAILNISLNAVQAMCERGGTLTIRTMGDEDRITIEIADTGPGIPEADRARIFEPYFTTKGGGTGLGLALSARIIADHHGTIDYDCPPEGGTVFRVTLKPADTAAPPKEFTA